MTALGDSFTLTETARNSPVTKSQGNREAGDYHSEPAGLESYTLHERGDNFSQTVTGAENYRVIQDGNSASGEFHGRRFKSFTGNYTRTSTGTVVQPNVTNQSYTTSYRAGGNPLHADLGVETTNSRYDLVELFIDGSNTNVTATNPGSVDRLPVGAPFAAAFAGVGVRLPADYTPETGPAGELWSKNDSWVPFNVMGFNFHEVTDEWLKSGDSRGLQDYYVGLQSDKNVAAAAADPDMARLRQEKKEFDKTIRGIAVAQQVVGSRAAGVARAAGGGIEIVGGLLFSSTLIGALVGVPMMGHGADEGLAGLGQAWTGESQLSCFEEDVLMGMFGASKEDAQLFNAGVSVVLQIGGGLVAGGAARAAATVMLVGGGIGGGYGLYVTGDWRGAVQGFTVGAGVAGGAYALGSLGVSAARYVASTEAFQNFRAFVSRAGTALDNKLSALAASLESPMIPGALSMVGRGGPRRTFPTLPGGTGAAYDEAMGQGVYILRERGPNGQIRYVGRGDAPARLYDHSQLGSGNDDLVGQILFNNNLPAPQAISLENQIMHALGGPKSVNPNSPLRNMVQGIAESNPNFLGLEFAADDNLFIEALRRAGLLGR